MSFAIIVMFVLGIGNFALHRAVLESGHPMLGQFAPVTRVLGGRFTLIVEFAILLGAMLLVANGWPGLVWAYIIYSVFNAVSAWLMLSGRV